MQTQLQARNDSDAAQKDTARTVQQKRGLEGNGPKAVAQSSLAEMMNDSPRVVQQRALNNAIHNSPRMVAQRHQMNALFGEAVKPQEEGAMPAEASLAQRKEKTNNTGLPKQLKSGIESLSGMSMDHVKVHYNSSRPAQLNAHAFAQGSDIHVAPGQARHLPHEAWHVVQQAQERVQPTTQAHGMAINDSHGLEVEADTMGAKAIQGSGGAAGTVQARAVNASGAAVQLKSVAELGAVATQVQNVGQIPSPNPVFTIGATHTGDIYQVKAAHAVAGAANANILIWGVNRADDTPSLNSAWTLANYFGGTVYYKTGGPPNGNLNNAQRKRVAKRTWNNSQPRGIINEGGATSVIMYGFDHARTQDAGGGTVHRDALRDSVADAVAPVGARAAQYQTDLTNRGYFADDGNYVLVNFRMAGHTGGAHPHLDSGEAGFKQLIRAVKQRVPDAVPVPMGEYDPFNAVTNHGPNLITYWNWPSAAGGRGPQAGLLRYMKGHYPGLKAIGMRSGIMDLMALAGIPIISIDADPVTRSAGGDPTGVQDSHAHAKAWGWDRGMKLEKAFGPEYGRVFIRDARVGETGVADAHWPGIYSDADKQRIRDGIDNYHGAAPARDASHPLSAASLGDTIGRLEAKRLAGALTPGEAATARRLQAVLTSTSAYNEVAGRDALLNRITALLA